MNGNYCTTENKFVLPQQDDQERHITIEEIFNSAPGTVFEGRFKLFQVLCGASDGAIIVVGQSLAFGLDFYAVKKEPESITHFGDCSRSAGTKEIAKILRSYEDSLKPSKKDEDRSK